MGALFGGGSQVDEWRGSDWARSGWNQYFDKDNPNREGTFTRLVQDTYGGPNAFQYQGQRVAEVDPWQNYAAQKIGEVNEAPGLDMAQRWLDQTISGVNTQGPGQDWQDAAWRNEYMGQNPYFDQMLTQAKQSTIDDYKDIIAPQEATAATMAGAFGGGAYQKQVGRNQGQLMDKLGQLETGLRGQQYDRSAGMYENMINRTQNTWGDERNRQLGSLDRQYALNATQLNNANAAMGVGDLFRNVNQQELDAAKDAWWEGKMSTAQYIEMMVSMLQRASGAGGSTISTGGGASPWAAGAGGLLAGIGALGGKG